MIPMVRGRAALRRQRSTEGNPQAENECDAKKGPVAQLDRVPDSESGGHRFKSCQGRQARIMREKPEQDENIATNQGGV